MPVPLASAGTTFGAVSGASSTTCTADAGDTAAVTGSAFP